MLGKCPSCNGLNVRRSSVPPAEKPALHWFRSPYRCRDCGTKFWRISGRVQFLGSVAVLLLIGFATMQVVMWAGSRQPVVTEALPASDAGQFEKVLALAQQGDGAAEYDLYQRYAKGLGVGKNDRDARIWLKRAAEHGDPDAQHELAIMLRDGRGVLQDYEGALKWMHLAAAGGNAQAQFDLGMMFRSGTGMVANLSKSYMWLSFAAAQNFPGAAEMRDSVLSRLSPDEVIAAQAEARRLSESMPKIAAGRRAGM